MALDYVQPRLRFVVEGHDTASSEWLCDEVCLPIKPVDEPGGPDDLPTLD